MSVCVRVCMCVCVCVCEGTPLQWTHASVQGVP